MKQQTSQVVIEASCPENKSGLRAGFFNAVWIVPAVAVLVVILFLVLGRARITDTGRHFLTAMIYSTFIGVPSAISLTWVSYRYAGKIPRLIILLQALILLCAAAFGSLMAALVIQALHIIPHNSYWFEFRESYPFATVITLITGLSITSFETLRHKLQAATLEARTRQMEQERANKLLAEARLSSLESRIHPHFLFNTLNSISALIPSDPLRAEATVGKLASLLRFSLNANHKSLVPLEQELKIVRDYLDIESTRFGARLRYEISVPSTLDTVKIPPLALQTLVENSVKHVVANSATGATIRVSGIKDAGQVQLQVTDDGPGFSLESISPDHGLGNLVARLELLFGERAQLNVMRRSDETIVSMTFPAEA